MFKPKLYMCISVFLLSGLMADEAYIQWDYSKDRGPKYWGELDKNFTRCKHLLILSIPKHKKRNIT